MRFGGEGGATVQAKAGDAVLIPAGVGHKRLSGSPDLLVIGAYPRGQRADLMREGAEDTAGIRRRIAAVPLPAADPVAGAAPAARPSASGRRADLRPRYFAGGLGLSCLLGRQRPQRRHHVDQARRRAVDEGQRPAHLDRRDADAGGEQAVDDALAEAGREPRRDAVCRRTCWTSESPAAMPPVTARWVRVARARRKKPMVPGRPP